LYDLPGTRTFTRRIASFDVIRDPISGHRIPTFIEAAIDGTLVEQSGDMPAFAAGLVMTQNAVFFTRDTVTELDQIRDGTKLYEVRQIEEKPDKVGVLVYRACHLHRLELYIDTSIFSGGSGTVDDPWVIKNIDQLQAMKNHLTAYYILGNDIDASTTSTWNEDLPGNPGTYLGFEPVGTADNQFTGNFNGQGHKIYDLYINRPATPYVGLFGKANGIVVKNLGLENVNVTGDHYTGGLIGLNEAVGEGNMSNCYSTGSVTGGGDMGEGDMAGGLAGEFNGPMDSCHSSCSVNSSASYVGGLVGWTQGTVTNCYSTGNVSGHDYVGGFAGGISTMGDVVNCYSIGSVDGNGAIGGFVGGIGSATMVNCYSMGVVSGISYVGGLVGKDESGGVENSFWDMDTSEQPTSALGTGKTTEQMKDVRTYTSLEWSGEGLAVPWDFVGTQYDDEGTDDIWDINSTTNDGYPFLTPPPPLTSTEPRYIIRTWFDPSFEACKVNADDMIKHDERNATFEADYEMGENNLKTLFIDVGLDIIFVIKKVRTEPIKAGRNTIGYRHFIGIQPCVINKLLGGTINVQATELLGKALDEVRRVIRESIDSGSMITMSNEQPEIQRLGSTLLHGDTCIVRWEQYISA
jgi:hypothetical protein